MARDVFAILELQTPTTHSSVGCIMQFASLYTSLAGSCKGGHPSTARTFVPCVTYVNRALPMCRNFLDAQNLQHMLSAPKDAVESRGPGLLHVRFTFDRTPMQRMHGALLAAGASAHFRMLPPPPLPDQVILPPKSGNIRLTHIAAKRSPNYVASSLRASLRVCEWHWPILLLSK